MRVRGLDTNHDWIFGQGRSAYKVGLDAVSQDINTRLNSFLGDCFFARQDGIDWFNLIGSKNLLTLQIAITTQILNTQGVLGIINISFDLNHRTRNFTAIYKIQASEGVVSGTFTSESVLTFLTDEAGLVLTTEDGTPITTG